LAIAGGSKDHARAGEDGAVAAAECADRNKKRDENTACITHYSAANAMSNRL
jgi:hypothetical protein